MIFFFQILWVWQVPSSPSSCNLKKKKAENKTTVHFSRNSLCHGLYHRLAEGLPRFSDPVVFPANPTVRRCLCWALGAGPDHRRAGGACWEALLKPECGSPGPEPSSGQSGGQPVGGSCVLSLYLCPASPFQGPGPTRPFPEPLSRLGRCQLAGIHGAQRSSRGPLLTWGTQGLGRSLRETLASQLVAGTQSCLLGTPQENGVDKG